MARLHRFAWTICLSAVVVPWFAAPASAAEIFYGFSLQPTNSALVAIDTTTGVATAIGQAGYSNLTGSAFAPDGHLYAITGTAAISVNLSNGHGSFLETTPTSFMGMDIGSDGTAYLGTGGGRLWKRDWATGTYTNIGNMGFSNFMDFAINSQGELFAVASAPSPPNAPPTGSSFIYRINTTTGQGTLVTTIDVPCLMGLAFGAGDSLFATEFCGGPYPLYKIDLSTGNATVVGSSTGIGSLHGGDIYTTPEPSTWLIVAPILSVAWCIRKARRKKSRAALVA